MTGRQDVLVEIAGVHKHYGGTEVLRGIDLEVREGEVLCLIGPSGSGKSTLLRCVNHLEVVDAGYVRIGDDYMGAVRRDGRLHEAGEKEQARQRRQVGMVFQHFNLFGHLTALENITVGLRTVAGMSKGEARARALDALEQVNMMARKDAYPLHLSGGQQQRVAIARSLAMRPRVMLFDEPTSALDPELVGEVLAVMRDVAASGMTMLVVTHELRFARQVADRIAFMDAGRIQALGSPEEVLDRSGDERVMAFVSDVR
ncbi:MAG: amino acid ABC transporter ATP-binding protein [Microbacterium sp.]